MNIEQKRGQLLNEQVEAGIRGDFARGWEISEELRGLVPNCNRAGFNRAWYEMMRGDLLAGLKLLDCGRWEKAFGDPPLPTNKPIYRDEDLSGKFLLFCSEGGLGDEIINVRFVTDFARKGARVTVTCDPSLATVFSRIEGVASVIGHRRAPDIYHDFWVPAMSAARILEKTYDSLDGRPYLSADPTYVAKWKPTIESMFGSRARIGLRFYGNPKFEHEQHRRFPIDGLTKAIGDRPWINLQKEESALNLETWEDTLAILSQLDLVITSCTSVAHASAALGKETWVITPILPYYIWALPGETSPWYNSVRLFRQEKFGDWTSVFEKIKTELASKRLK
jgi:hypothetical protein